MKKLRKMGDVLLDLETILDEMAEDHDMQLGEILSLVKNQLVVHNPGCIEEYEDETKPVYYYGHKDHVK